MKKIKRIFTNIIFRTKHIAIQTWRRFIKLLAYSPLLSFMAFLVILVGLVVVGNYIRKPVADNQTQVAQPKTVTVFGLGTTPELKVQAKIEKSGVIKLVAQTSGVVQKIKVTEGAQVKRGTSLFNLSTNYQGANLPAVSRQISQKTYQNALDTYPLSLDSINKSRIIAQKTEAKDSELRAIARQSIDETKSLITLNEEIVTGFNTQISNLEAINVNGASDSAILALKGSKSQTLAALNGLKSGLRNTEYLNNNDKESAQISTLIKENTLKQLDIQEKALNLSKDIAGLNLKITQINESLMYPGSPCPGTVERIHVKVGQLVNPGTVLATIRGDENTATAVVLVSAKIARNVSPYQLSYLMVNDQQVGLELRNVSQEPTEGSLHSVVYSIPDQYAGQLTNDSSAQVVMPIGAPSQLPSVTSDQDHPYVPLDAVYQSQDAAYIYIVGTNPAGQTVAHSQQVELGQVYGSYVEITSPLNNQVQIILDRNVIDGDLITPVDERVSELG